MDRKIETYYFYVTFVKSTQIRSNLAIELRENQFNIFNKPQDIHTFGKQFEVIDSIQSW